MNTKRLSYITLAAALLMTINGYAGDVSGNVYLNLVPALTNQVKRVVLYPDGKGPDEALVAVDVSGDGSFALEAPAGVNVRVSAFLDRNGDGLFSQSDSELVSAPSSVINGSAEGIELELSVFKRQSVQGTVVGTPNYGCAYQLPRLIDGDTSRISFAELDEPAGFVGLRLEAARKVAGIWIYNTDWSYGSGFNAILTYNIRLNNYSSGIWELVSENDSGNTVYSASLGWTGASFEPRLTDDIRLGYLSTQGNYAPRPLELMLEVVDESLLDPVIVSTRANITWAAIRQKRTFALNVEGGSGDYEVELPEGSADNHLIEMAGSDQFRFLEIPDRSELEFEFRVRDLYTGLSVTRSCVISVKSVLPLYIDGTAIRISGGFPLRNGINLEDTQVIAEKRIGMSPVSVFYEVMHRFPCIEYIRLPLHPGTSGQQAEGCSGFHSDPRAYLIEYVVPIVRAAEREGVYVILSGHWVTDYSSGLIENEVMPFVQAVAEVFGDNPAIILEPFNESINTSDTSWGEYRNAVAQPLVDYYRVCGGQGLVLVGAPHWNRLFDGADTNPVVDPLNKTAYSMHIYPSHFADVESYDAQYGHLLDALPFMVTEWGFSDSGDAHLVGDVESYAEPFVNYLEAYGVPHSAWLYSSSWQPAILNADNSLSEFGLFVQGRLCEAGTMPQDDVVFVEGVVNDKFLTPAYARDLPHCVSLHRVGDTPAENSALSQVDSDGAFMLLADDVAEDELYVVSVFVDSNNSGSFESGELFITSPERFGRGFHGDYEILFSSFEWQSLGRAFGTENYGYNAIATLVDGDIAVGTVLDEAPGYFGTIPNDYNPVSLGGVRFKSLPWTYGVNPITIFSVDCMQNGVWVEVSSMLEAGPDMWNTALFDGLVLAQAVRVRYLTAMYAPTVAEIQILAQASSAGGYDLWSSLLASDQQSEIATPAEDGIPNLIKYTCGLNPLVSSVTSEYMNITNRNNGCFEVLYYVDPTVEDAEVKPLFSADLKTWYPVNASLIHTYGVEGSREKYLISIPYHKRGFIKLTAQYISY